MGLMYYWNSGDPLGPNVQLAYVYMMHAYCIHDVAFLLQTDKLILGVR